MGAVLLSFLSSSILLLSVSLILLVVCITGPVLLFSYHLQWATHSSLCKFDISTFTTEVIKLARKYMKLAFLNGSSCWARKGRAISMLKSSSQFREKYYMKSKYYSFGQARVFLYNHADMQGFTALPLPWCQWYCLLSPAGGCQFSRGRGRISSVGCSRKKRVPGRI